MLAAERLDRQHRSVSGLSGHEGEAIYSTAKAAVHEYTRCLPPGPPHNVHVNAVAPGGVVTPAFWPAAPSTKPARSKTAR